MSRRHHRRGEKPETRKLVEQYSFYKMSEKGCHLYDKKTKVEFTCTVEELSEYLDVMMEEEL